MSFDSSAAGWFVLDISVRAALAAAGVALVLRLFRVRTAAVRHAAWTLVLIAMLLMPLWPSLVPALPLPIPISASGVMTTSDAPPPGGISRTTPSATGIAAATATRDGGATRPVQPDSQSAPSAAPPARWLPPVLIVIYLAGVLFFLTRLASGWYLASRMVRRAQRGGPVGIDIRGIAYESPEVAVPMTVGALRPVIVLPLAWREWDEDTRAAVIAHETAHVQRHDALVSLIARLNRALFWFHPLAGWLERTLVVTAEHACDEAAVRSVAEPRRYAEILIEMADAVRRNRGRVVWQAVGVDGSGLLEGRIDRVLRENGFAKMRRASKVAALLACAALVLLVIACRQQVAAAPLKEDPALTERLRQQDAGVKRFEAARDMTEEQADALEKTLEANPEDFDARGQLVIHYTASGTVPWDKKVAGQRRHALWLIQHYPEHEVMPPALSPEYDPEGFAAAKKLWESHLAKPNVSPFLVYRAARFFAPHDKPFAEQLLLRGMAMDPQSAALKARMPDVGVYQWRVQLANLYAAALNGSESMWGTYNDLRTHLDKLNTPFVQTVRTKLDASSDARLLASVGAMLTHQRGQEQDLRLQEAHDRARDLGLGYLRRALQLDPNLESAKVSLYFATAMETEGGRLASQAEMASARNDGTKEAEKILEQAQAHANDPAYSGAIMSAHQTLALTAARKGDRGLALQHLNDSLKVPVSDQIRYAPPMAWMAPVNELLKAGERERVVQFLEAYAQLAVRDRQRLLDDAKAIREGRMPLSYQHMAYRETTPSPFKLVR